MCVALNCDFVVLCDSKYLKFHLLLMWQLVCGCVWVVATGLMIFQVLSLSE